ncbi:MAG: hypothetical protein IKF96_05895 [Eggerthellaceae bacterium]|nr:hypothetical protein [Eggerthellaceae bacterium]
MSGDMVVTLLFCMFGMLLFGFALYRLRFRTVRIEERIEALTLEGEE